MPRIRTIKPEFWQDEKIGRISRDGRLLFIGLWNESDDYGTVRSNPVYLRNRLFPYDADLTVAQVSACLDELVAMKLLLPFVYNGEGYYHIRSFNSHQKIEKASKPIVPLEEKEALTGFAQQPTGKTASAKSPTPPKSNHQPVGEISEGVGENRLLVGEESATEIGSSNSKGEEKEKEGEGEQQRESENADAPPPPSLPSAGMEVWQHIGPPFGDAARNAWLALCRTTHWRSRPPDSLRYHLQKIIAFDEEFALSLLHHAIDGSYKALTYDNTQEKYQTWKAGKTANKEHGLKAQLGL